MLFNFGKTSCLINYSVIFDHFDNLFELMIFLISLQLFWSHLIILGEII